MLAARSSRLLRQTVAVAMVVTCGGFTAHACPFCSAPSLTLTEQLTQADAAVLAKWVRGKPAKDQDPGETVFEVVEVVQGAKVKKLAVGDSLSLVRFRPAKPGDLYLLLGTLQGTMVDWGSPIEVSREAFDYMKAAPRPDVKPTERLRYFVKYLEHADQMIATDAYGEFANAAYGDITPLAADMPRDKLRGWVADPKTSPSRLGLYGLMLGLSGTPDDAQILASRIFESTEEFRLGIDGVMGGYLLLTRDEGLAQLDQKKLVDHSVPFSETYAAMQALRFMWQYGDGKITADRLRESMRLLLDRPELADLVVADLARWKDWSIQDRLMKLYGETEYDIPSIKRAIVRYFLAAAKDMGADGQPAPHAEQAAKHLASLELTDPKTVADAKRFFFVK